MPNLLVPRVQGTTADLEWQTPADVGNGPIQGYVVVYKLEQQSWNESTQVALDAAATSHLLSQLQELSGYDVRLSAHNTFGAGPAAQRAFRTGRANLPLEQTTLNTSGPIKLTVRGGGAQGFSVGWSACSFILPQQVAVYRRDPDLGYPTWSGKPICWPVGATYWLAEGSYDFRSVSVVGGTTTPIELVVFNEPPRLIASPHAELFETPPYGWGLQFMFDPSTLPGTASYEFQYSIDQVNRATCNQDLPNPECEVDLRNHEINHHGHLALPGYTHSLPSGQTYYYRIRPLDAAGKELSGWSPVVSGKAYNYWNAQQNLGPSLNSAVPYSFGDGPGIRIGFTPTSRTNVASYEVQYTVDWKSWVRCDTRCVISVPNRQIDHHGLSSGQTYYYLLRALDGSGKPITNWSNGVSAVPPAPTSVELSPPNPLKTLYDGSEQVSFTVASYSGAVQRFSWHFNAYGGAGYTVASGCENGDLNNGNARSCTIQLTGGLTFHEFAPRGKLSVLLPPKSVRVSLWGEDASDNFLVSDEHTLNYERPQPCNANPCPIFIDVAADYWAFQYIEWLYGNGYVSGTRVEGDQRWFEPEKELSRAQMSVLLVRAQRPQDQGYVPGAPEYQAFGDAGLGGNWADKWIFQLFDDGITSGCSAAPPLYCPDGANSRAQMAVFAERVMHGEDFRPAEAWEQIFGDVPLTQNGQANWAAKWVNEGYYDALVQNCKTDTQGMLYFPERPTTRAEAACMLYFALNNAKAAAPAINPAGGEYTGAVQVNLSSATSGASIRYTLDGTTPGLRSTLYQGPIALSSSAELTARAFKDGLAGSDGSSALFTISAMPQPDLAVQDLAFAPSSPMVGESVAVSVTVKNEGGAATEATSIACRVGSAGGRLIGGNALVTFAVG